MPDDTNPSPEAEALARVLWPNFDRETYPSTWLGMIHQAQRAVDAEWTPQPDSHVEIARELRDTLWPHEAGETFPDGGTTDDRLLAAVRRLDLRRGDQ